MGEESNDLAISHGGLNQDNFESEFSIFVQKHESFKVFEILCKKVQNEKGFCISSIRSDHETEFENSKFISFYEKNGIFHNFSSPRTPQQKRGT